MTALDRRPTPFFEEHSPLRGAYGEAVAARFLQRRGYKVLYRNFRVPQGEIDLVCRHGETLVFVEVKTSSRAEESAPGERVLTLQQRRVRRAAQAWLGKLDQRDIPTRFDVVQVQLTPGEPPVCELIENAQFADRPGWS